LGLLLGLRDRSACVALSGVAAATMHLGWSIGFWRALAQHLAGASETATPTPAAAP
jgi:succinoglycan biosynthesis protein ExoA